jgi:DNA-binding response OmpR family regulator
MTKNQPDNPALTALARQIEALGAGAGGAIALYWEEGQLVAGDEKEAMQRFSTPVKIGTVLNFIRRHHNRSALENLPDSLVLGPYRFHPRLSSLTRENNGDSIVLTDKERDILAALWLAPDQALSREELLAAVWAYAEGVETHTLETHIYRLRQKIEQDPSLPSLLVNSEGTYRLRL